ncbi:transposase [Chelatococcus asaccharovorans]
MAPCRKHGVSDAIIHKWKAKFDGMDVSEARVNSRERERQAEAEAGRCDARQCCAGGASGKEVVTPTAAESRRASFAHHAMSERLARKAIGCCRMTVRYQSGRLDDRALRERMIALHRLVGSSQRPMGGRRSGLALRNNPSAFVGLLNFGLLNWSRGEPVRRCRRFIVASQARVLVGYHRTSREFRRQFIDPTSVRPMALRRLAAASPLPSKSDSS